MPSNHLILCRPLLLLPSIFPSIRVFSNELVPCIRWPKYWSFSFSISPSNEYSGLISLQEVENGRAEGSSTIGEKSKLQLHSCPTLMAQVLVPGTRCVFAPLKSTHLECLYNGDLLHLLHTRHGMNEAMVHSNLNKKEDGYPQVAWNLIPPGLGANGYTCMYGWIPSLFTWNYNIVNQLLPNRK